MKKVKILLISTLPFHKKFMTFVCKKPFSSVMDGKLKNIHRFLLVFKLQEGFQKIIWLGYLSVDNSEVEIGIPDY
jgi:hypothetical protein